MQRKLYWRVKINGKWTWRPATIVTNKHVIWPQVCVRSLVVEDVE